MSNCDSPCLSYIAVLPKIVVVWKITYFVVVSYSNAVSGEWKRKWKRQVSASHEQLLARVWHGSLLFLGKFTCGTPVLGL